jgi:hypothetical protein
MRPSGGIGLLPVISSGALFHAASERQVTPFPTQNSNAQAWVGVYPGEII